MKTTTINERESYNALIGLSDPSPTQTMYALIKVCYRITPDVLRLTTPEPFFHDINDETLSPRLKAGTDFYPIKQATDVVVQGSAFCASPESMRKVMVSVGHERKLIMVFGKRRILSSNGRVVIDRPEPFLEMPLTYENAYGGIDNRIEIPKERANQRLVDCDHPGLYPRNPFGKGYLACAGELPDTAEMPNLEDPGDLLTEDRIVLSDPARWYRQPLPTCFDWMPVMCFPRYIHMGADAWFEAPEDESMPEVRQGFLPKNYRSSPDAFENHLGFYQEASLGMTLRDIRPGYPVSLFGMHPEKDEIFFSVPSDPMLTVNCEGNETQLPVRLHHMVCRPAEETVYFVYGASRPLHRTFIPGIHKHIPISISVNGDSPIRYEAPQTMKSRLEEAFVKQGV